MKISEFYVRDMMDDLDAVYKMQGDDYSDMRALTAIQAF